MKQMGEIFLDARASPGLTEAEARAFGYDPFYCGEGKVYEQKTGTCSHCRTVVVFNPQRTRARTHCMKCNHYICDGCAYLAEQPDYVHKDYFQLYEEHLTKVAKGT